MGMKPEFSVSIPATSANLGPGFDCMGLALDLFNYFKVTTESSFEISVEGVAAHDIPQDETNLFIKAAEVLLTHVASSLSTKTWQVEMVTGIPSASGLGSSASAIAAGMLLANEILGFYEPHLQMTRPQVVELATAMEGHPDNVTAALLGGAWLSIYHDDILRSFDLALPDSLHFTVATPTVKVSTDESRRALSELIPRSDAVYNVGQAARLMIALERGELHLLRDGFGDKLHEPYRTDAIPHYEEAVAAAMEAGAATVTLSGSGPTLLAWCEGTAVAQAVRAAMEVVWSAHNLSSSMTVHRPLLEEPTVTVMETREAKL
jgi:homoserine kinase